MKKERLVKRRVVPVVILTVLTLLFTFLMGIRNTMPLDEVVVLFFLDKIKKKKKKINKLQEKYKKENINKKERYKEINKKKI